MTEAGGADNDGMVFEIAKSTGLLSTVATITDALGGELNGGLIINSACELFGTAYYGVANNDGLVFELPATFVATPAVDNTTTVTDSDRMSKAVENVSTHATSDVIGNDTSDVLLQKGGGVLDWIMNNRVYQSGNVLSTGAAGWNVVGTGDFTGQRHRRCAAANGGGTLIDWIMHNGAYQSGNVIANAPAGWNVVGTGDFTGNGTDDFLLQNGGAIVYWIMKDGVYQSGNVLNTGAAGWNVVGTGDYNGDGTSDILLQNGGTVVDWIMKDGAYQSGNILTTAASGWNVAHG